MTLRVLLVDDQMLIRQGIKSLLQLSGQVEVVAEAPDGSTVVELVQLHQPDVVLLDLSMPKVDGIATLELLKQQQLKTPVLILTTFEEHDLVLKSIQLGAKGYLLKDVSLDSLVSAIQTLQQGGTCFQSAGSRQPDAGCSHTHGQGHDGDVEVVEGRDPPAHGTPDDAVQQGHGDISTVGVKAQIAHAAQRVPDARQADAGTGEQPWQQHRQFDALPQDGGDRQAAHQRGALREGHDLVHGAFLGIAHLCLHGSWDIRGVWRA